MLRLCGKILAALLALPLVWLAAALICGHIVYAPARHEGVRDQPGSSHGAQPRRPPRPSTKPIGPIRELQ